MSTSSLLGPTATGRVTLDRASASNPRGQRPAWVPPNLRGLSIRRRTKRPGGARASADNDGQQRSEAATSAGKKKTPGQGVNLFDPAATASRFLTRRFGILGGLGFVALLASTELYEIGKALFEVEKDGSGESVETASGLTYRDLKVGGGAQPKKGDFVGAQFVVKVREEVLLDTKTTGRPIAFTFGKRPYLSVNCEGVEEGLSGMRRGGVRELTVPPSLAYGGRSRELPNGALVPPDATVTFLITLEDVTGSYL